MAQLIDKNKVAAEIDERLHKYEQEYEELARYEIWGTAREIRPKIEELKNFRSFINTIETKDVNLGKEIKNRVDSLSNLYCYMEDLFNGNEEEGVYPIPEKVTNELFEFAKYFYELGLKTQNRE